MAIHLIEFIFKEWIQCQADKKFNVSSRSFKGKIIGSGSLFLRGNFNDEIVTFGKIQI